MKNEIIDKLKELGYITVTADSQGIADQAGIGGDSSDSSSGSEGKYFPIAQPLLSTELILDREDHGGYVYQIDGVDSNIGINNLFLAENKDSLLCYFTNSYYDNIDEACYDNIYSNIIIKDIGSNTTYFGGLFIDDDGKLKLFTEDRREPNENFVIQYTPQLYIKK